MMTANENNNNDNGNERMAPPPFPRDVQHSIKLRLLELSGLIAADPTFEESDEIYKKLAAYANNPDGPHAQFHSFSNDNLAVYVQRYWSFVTQHDPEGNFVKNNDETHGLPLCHRLQYEIDQNLSK